MTSHFRCLRTFFVCISIASAFQINAQILPKDLPDQLINQIVIEYERTGGNSPRGTEIIKEHQKLVSLVSAKLNVVAKNHRPVFTGVVNQMISRNMTESEWQRAPGAKKDRQKRTAQTERSTLSTTITVKLDGDQRHIESVLRQINDGRRLFEDDGFRIISAEPVRLIFMTHLPDDSLFSSQWSHQVTGATSAWDTETGDADVVIAIIDSGVDTDHEDLKPNVLLNGRDFVNIDTQLYTDYGYTLIPEEDYTTFDNNPMDYGGHGTHVAGIAAGAGNNGKGIAGVCHSCSILPVRAGFSILYDGNEYGVLEDAAIANAIVFATDNGADVINMSFGGRNSSAMKNAVAYAHSHGVLLVAAAGNSGTTELHYPAAYDHVLSVASSDSQDKMSWFATHGTWIDLVAPGESIISTVPKTGGFIAHADGYRVLDGSSMASPYVAGLAGLLKSKNPAWTADEIGATIISTTDDLDAVNPDYISKMGYGRVNAGRAVNNTPAPNVIFDTFSFSEFTGNQNGHINPGEQIALVVNLKNTWVTANAVSAILTTSDPFVSITQSTANYAGMLIGESKSNASGPFLFTVSASTPDDHEMNFNLAIRCDGNTRNIALKLPASVTDKLEVPAMFSTIQAAINAALDGDEIVVSPGTYYENIDFLGKNISVVSLYHSTGDRKYIETTIIDGSKPVNIEKASTVTIRNGENATTLLSGFTIQGGSGTYTVLPEGMFYNYFGGGIFCVESSPVLKDLIIRNNTLTSSNGSGAGILISHGAPSLSNLYITGNKVSAGLYISRVNNPEVMARDIHVTNSIEADGIYITVSNVRLGNITVEGCIASFATGLFTIYSTVEIDGAVISGNTKGLDTRACDRVTLRNAAITNNGDNGGIWCSTTALDLINTTVAGNNLTNHYGGAGIFITNVDSKVTLVNSILYNNKWTELNTGIVRESTISFLDDGGELNVAYSNLEGSRDGIKYFDGSSNVTLNWLDGNINSDPLFFRPAKNDYHLSGGSPSSGTGTQKLEYNGRLYLDLKSHQFEGAVPDMGAYLFNQSYVKAAFTSDRTEGNKPLSVQFTDESYGYKTTPPDTWTWDFGDGITSTSRNPLHQYGAVGEYTVKLKVSNNAHADEDIKLALIKVFDSDTVYVSTTSGSNTTGLGTKTKPYKTIQHGINQASDNDVVLVSNGTYAEHLNFGGKNVRVSSYYLVTKNGGNISATIIDGSDNGRVVTFENGEGKNAGLYGVTIHRGFANGTWPTYEGGGIYIVDSSPTLMDVVVTNNKANYRGGGIFISNGDPHLERITVSFNQTVEAYGSGGGIYIEQSDGVIWDSKINSNTATEYGGGILLGYNATPDMKNVTIRDNKSGRYGGGLHIQSNKPDLSGLYVMNNAALYGGGISSSFSNSVIGSSVIAGNTAANEGGGIYYIGNAANPRMENVTVYNNTSPVGREIKTNGSAKVVISSSIVWNTTGVPISGTALITYSDVKGGYAGTGNINSDPKLLNPSAGDYALDMSSPCIDAGDPNKADPNGTVVDMGALPYDRPIISGVSAAVEMIEDVDRLLRLSDFAVKNVDSDYPASYSVIPGPGAHYTTSGSIIKPEANYYGNITIPVTITNNTTTSQVFNLPIVVNPVNDAPVIAGQKLLVTIEEEPIQVMLHHLIVTDVDNESASFVLTILEGGNYTTLPNNVVVPLPDFRGTLYVPAVVSDGTHDSAPFILMVSVIAANDAPVVSGQRELLTKEDNDITLTLDDLVVTDVDNAPASFVLKIFSGTDYTISGSRVSPAKDFNGTLMVRIAVNDGLSDSEPFDLNITVTPVNDVPVISGQHLMEVGEDNGIDIAVDDLIASDVDNASSDFVLKVSPGANYLISGNTLLPATDYNGALSVSVIISDGTNDSEPFDLKINVLPVNDAPLISGHQTFEMDEDIGKVLTFEHLGVDDVDNASADLTMRIIDGENYNVTGNTIVAAANFNGTLTIPVVVSDGVADSNPFDVTVTVLPVNDAPAITGAKEFDITSPDPLTLSIVDLEVSDIDNEISELILHVLSGAGYTVAGNTIQVITGFVGELQIAVKVNDGKTDSEVFMVTANVTVITNAENSLEPVIHLYPNPAQDHVYVTNSLTRDIVRVELFSVEGKPIAVEQTEDGDGILISVAHVSSGHYFIRVHTKEGIVWRRLVVRR